MKAITRRRWLVEALALASLPGTLQAIEPNEETLDFADYKDFQVDLQAASPRVKCYDLRRFREPLTPNAEFFVFHQTTVPSVDVANWRLEIGGLVERPATLTMAELTDIAGTRQELEFTLECAGNLQRPEIMNGQIGNARWSGFSLTTLLKHCGVKSEAREAVFFGADQVRDSSGVPFGPHGRSVFVQDLEDSDAILATHMNGEPLPAEHGSPLRLILPGWYGMAQIKWLSRIEFIDRRYEGAHMSRNYHTLHVLRNDRENPLLLETSIAKTRLKSVVARVSRRRRNQTWEYQVTGAAWGGTLPIDRVEVQIDGGDWHPAQIEERRGKYAWLLWAYNWANISPGRHTLSSRATDIHGAVQPSPDEWRSAIKSARENNSQWERVIHIPG
jgi:DMSO/TMAO reductase YedYZ molybdopterin-dependent catalytic subunit